MARAAKADAMKVDAAKADTRHAHGRLRGLDPRTKLYFMALTSGACVFSTSPAFLTSMLMVSFLVLAIGGADLWLCLRRCKALIALIASLFVIQSVFAFRGDPTAMPLIAIQGFTVISVEGMLLAAVLSLRLLTIVVTAQILLEGDIRDYLLALVQMRIPYELAFMVMVGLHFLPLLREEAISVYQCMQLRGVAFKGISLPRKVRAYAGISLPILVGTLRRADEMSVAMELRGLRAYPKRTYLRRLSLHAHDVVAMALCSVLVCGAFIAFSGGLWGVPGS
jgi:energy-coupling factor transport system permease protein